MTASPGIRSCQKTFFCALLLSVCYVLHSHLHVIYAGNGGMLSGIQTPNNVAMTNSTLQITTDKQRYLLEETVFVTIKNKMKMPLEFPDSILGLNIENVETGQKAGLLAAQVITELNPNESKTFQWDQKDTNANQTAPGIYKAETSSITRNPHDTQPITANTIFSIRQDAQ
jgi:glycosidase